MEVLITWDGDNLHGNNVFRDIILCHMDIIKNSFPHEEIIFIQPYPAFDFAQRCNCINLTGWHKIKYDAILLYHRITDHILLTELVNLYSSKSERIIPIYVYP